MKYDMIFGAKIGHKESNFESTGLCFIQWNSSLW